MAISKIVANSVDLDGAITINESSNSVDFRVESNGNTHQLFVDGSGDNVGIGTTVMDALVNINSGAANAGLHVESTDSSANISLADMHL